jgi:hypothetical protein
MPIHKAAAAPARMETAVTGHDVFEDRVGFAVRKKRCMQCASTAVDGDNPFLQLEPSIQPVREG